MWSRLAEALQSLTKLDYVGGMAYLGALVENVPTAANIRRYAESCASARSCAGLPPPAAKSPNAPTIRWAAACAKSSITPKRKVFEIAEHGARGQQGFQDIRPLLTQVVERIEFLYNRDNPSDVTGVATGFTDLDR